MISCATKQKPSKITICSILCELATQGEMAVLSSSFLYPIHRILFIYCCCCYCRCSFSYSSFLLSLNMCNCEHKNVCLFASIVLLRVDWSVAHIFNTPQEKAHEYQLTLLLCETKQKRAGCCCSRKKQQQQQHQAYTLHTYQKHNAAMQASCTNHAECC